MARYNPTASPTLLSSDHRKETSDTYISSGRIKGEKMRRFNPPTKPNSFQPQEQSPPQVGPQGTSQNQPDAGYNPDDQIPTGTMTPRDIPLALDALKAETEIFSKQIAEMTELQTQHRLKNKTLLARRDELRTWAATEKDDNAHHTLKNSIWEQTRILTSINKDIRELRKKRASIFGQIILVRNRRRICNLDARTSRKDSQVLKSLIDQGPSLASIDGEWNSNILQEFNAYRQENEDRKSNPTRRYPQSKEAKESEMSIEDIIQITKIKLEEDTGTERVQPRLLLAINKHQTPLVAEENPPRGFIASSNLSNHNPLLQPRASAFNFASSILASQNQQTFGQRGFSDLALRPKKSKDLEQRQYHDSALHQPGTTRSFPKAQAPQNSLGAPRKIEGEEMPLLEVEPLPRPQPKNAYKIQASKPPAYGMQLSDLLLVIDLNGTLLHRPSKKRPQRYVARPNVKKFLHYITKAFPIVVWSSARPLNVQAMCDKLFKQHDRSSLVTVWGRDKFRLTDEQYNAKIQVYKDLELVWKDPKIAASHPEAANGKGWNQSNTVLLDDSKLKASAQPFNILEVPEFNGKETEEESPLQAIIGYLECMRWQEDVSAYMREKPFKVGQNWELGWKIREEPPLSSTATLSIDVPDREPSLAPSIKIEDEDEE